MIFGVAVVVHHKRAATFSERNERIDKVILDDSNGIPRRKHFTNKHEGVAVGSPHQFTASGPEFRPLDGEAIAIRGQNGGASS